MSNVPPWPDSPDSAHLHARWMRMLADTDATGAAASTWSAVQAAYTEPGRSYHTLEHIGEVLVFIDRLSDAASLALELAAWLHDVVYDVGAADSEARSADWTRARFAGLLPDGELDEACRLIRMTEAHRPEPADGVACVLADADLAILGSPPDRYRRYVADIRAEYTTFDDRAWAEGRRRVLESLLARPSIYQTAGMVDREQQARRNMASELAGLGGPDPYTAESGST